MIEVTDAQVYQTTREVVAEQPDYIYQNPLGHTAISENSVACYYVHDDKPGCVVGAVLHRLGVPLKYLSDREGLRGDQVALGLTNMSPDTAMFLRRVQIGQDRGLTWGDALGRAEMNTPATIFV